MPHNVAKVFTISYAGIQLPKFIEVLQQNGVTEKRINGDYDKKGAKIEYKK